MVLTYCKERVKIKMAKTTCKNRTIEIEDYLDMQNF